MGSNHQPQLELAINCTDLAREMALGPALFDDRGQPTAAVERYNGTRVTRDAERCLVAGALRLLAYSDRQIAEVLHCDVRSIPLMVREAEKAGRIPALKERLQILVAQNAEQSGIVLAQLLQKAARGTDSLELSAMLKAIGQVNAFQVDKHQLLTGAATEILEVRMGAGQEERLAWAKAHSIPLEPVDSDSTGTSPEPQQTAMLSPARPTDDTLTAAPTGQPAVADPVAAAAKPPGGGVALSPGGRESKTVSDGSKF